MKELLTQIYSSVFEEKLIEELALVSTLHAFEEGDIIIDFGNSIKQMPLLVSGAVKILREDFEEAVNHYLQVCKEEGVTPNPPPIKV